jgi:hypothetical protein
MCKITKIIHTWIAMQRTFHEISSKILSTGEGQQVWK